MATVNKDFKIKSGLIVEGLQGTINGEVILTENAGDQYILDLIGGETLVKSVEATQLEVSVAGKLSVKAEVFDDFGAAADAESNAAADATSKANAAQAAAEATAATDATNKANAVASDLTDHENATEAHGATGAVVGTTNTQTLTNKTIGDTLNFTGAGNMTINSDSHIVLTPAAGSSVKWGADVLATQGYADQAETDAKAYTDARETAITTAYQSYADTAEQDARNYADQKVADLVDSAPALLDTLNELAAAIGDDANFAANLATSVGEKVAKAGDTMTGALTLSGAPTSNLHAATKAYVDSAESNAISTASSDATSKADAAEDAAIAAAALDATAKADAAEDAAIAAAALDATSKANTAESNAIAHADALTTDDVAEGTTQYFTDARAKTSAADLLTGASLTNITITGTGSGLTITAENGVADSDTDDLAEGTTNLYFTDARAQGAINDTTPNFAAIEIDLVAKQVAAQTDAPTAGIQIAHAFAKADYRSAEYLVKVAYGTHTEISKVLLTLDSSDNIAITEYGIVGTNGSASSISAGISGTNVQLQVTTSNNNSTVTVMGTLLK